MDPIPFREQTNELGPPRGWPTGKCRSLPVHQGLAPYPSDGVDIPVTISCWQPTDEERAAIAAGKPVWLMVYTAPNGVPPVALMTETPFVEQPSASPASAEARLDGTTSNPGASELRASQTPDAEPSPAAAEEQHGRRMS